MTYKILCHKMREHIEKWKSWDRPYILIVGRFSLPPWILFLSRPVLFVYEMTGSFNEKVMGVRDLYFTRLIRQVSTTNSFSWQGNFDYRKSALDYATIGRSF